MNMNIISKYLQFLRKSNNYTQDDLAKQLGISRQAVSKWETGTTIPNFEVFLYCLIRISEYKKTPETRCFRGMSLFCNIRLNYLLEN